MVVEAQLTHAAPLIVKIAVVIILIRYAIPCAGVVVSVNVRTGHTTPHSSTSLTAEIMKK